MRAALLVGIALTLALLPGAAVAEKVPGWVEVDRVVAVVNSDVILDSEVGRRLAPMAAGGKPVPADARKQMVQLMIDETLLTQEASRVRIEVSDQDVSGAIEEIKKQNGIDDAGLEKALAAQGYTLALYREDVRQQILRLRAINIVIRPRVTVRDEEVEAAYKEARKANPKLGTFEVEKPKIHQALIEQRMGAETQKWLLERRLASFVAVKAS
jgi:peptidyl-prolyl cis-trans isomerase SurA